MKAQGATLETKAVIIGDKKLQAKLNHIGREMLTREIMGKISADATTHIKDRTLEGKDKNNRPFIGYSDKYLEFKKKRGAKFFSGKVNLFDGGDMFSAMQHQVRTNDTAEIIFTRSPQALKASGHHNGSAKSGLPKRQFFSLGREGDKRAVKLLNKHLVKVIGA